MLESLSTRVSVCWSYIHRERLCDRIEWALASILSAIRKEGDGRTPEGDFYIFVYIHGNGAQTDWTLGCIALENENMKELFDLAFVGMPVTIKP
jgi:L,D-peptidoglycan transpeptidase YkuD (ErfK/YbiS/YcfS/YnhG family)